MELVLFFIQFKVDGTGEWEFFFLIWMLWGGMRFYLELAKYDTESLDEKDSTARTYAGLYMSAAIHSCTTATELEKRVYHSLLL